MSRRREREPERVWLPHALELDCSVCYDPFDDPVALACGHTFCRQCAVRWFKKQDASCPTARCKASADSKPAELPTLFLVKSMVEALRVYCRHGLREDGWGRMADPEGCPAQLRLDEVAAHEASCGHAFEVCPFEDCGVKRRRRDADAHDVAAAHAPGEREARFAEREARLALEAELALVRAGDRGASIRRGAASLPVSSGAGVRVSQRGRRSRPLGPWWVVQDEAVPLLDAHMIVQHEEVPAQEAVQAELEAQRAADAATAAAELEARRRADEVEAAQRAADAATAAAELEARRRADEARARALEEEQLREAEAAFEAAASAALAVNAVAISPAVSPGLHAGAASDLENDAGAAPQRLDKGKGKAPIGDGGEAAARRMQPSRRAAVKRPAAVAFDGSDEHGCPRGECSQRGGGVGGPFLLPVVAPTPGAGPSEGRAVKPRMKKADKEACSMKPPPKNRTYCKCGSRGCGGGLCPNSKLQRSFCTGKGSKHEGCGNGMCPDGKKSRYICTGKGLEHEGCGGGLCPKSKKERYACNGKGDGHEGCGGRLRGL